MVESDNEDGSSEGEVDTKSMMKTLALSTKEYNRGFKRPSYRRENDKQDRGNNYKKTDEEKKVNREERWEEKRSHQKGVGRRGGRSESKGEKNKGCFKCSKPSHFASECYSRGSKPKP